MDPQLPRQRALAIAGERIAGGIGTHETALASPEVVDLRGRVVVPGLSDAHVHFPTWALAQTEVKLDGCSSLAEALARIGAASVPPGRVIRGYGWRSGDWKGGEEPTAARLDQVTGGRPAAMIAKDYHSLWLNSAALALAGGDLEVEGGVVERDARRQPDRGAARGGGMAVQGAPPEVRRRAVPRGDASGASRRRRTRRHLGPRQGRLARGVGAVAAAGAARLAHAPCLAVASGRPRRLAGASSGSRSGSAARCFGSDT